MHQGQEATAGTPTIGRKMAATSPAPTEINTVVVSGSSPPLNGRVPTGMTDGRKQHGCKEEGIHFRHQRSVVRDQKDAPLVHDC
jgi:hypothetical protein